MPAFSQDNSPYSRYGIGDLVPASNINIRGMGGISAAYADFLSVNFNNPASYSAFQSFIESKSKRLISGRAVLDVGLNFESHTLQESNPPRKFATGNALFSYVQVGLPLKQNWGMSFGLRPVSRISYKIFNRQMLKDPNTGLPIDSALTRFEGTGGTYLASVGTGFALIDKNKAGGKMKERLSFGVNAGYLFGKKDYSTKRSLYAPGDTVIYYQGNFESRTTYGSLYFTAGLQYMVPVDTTKRITLGLGAYGNWGQKVNASQDILRETFVFDDNLGDVRLDSVYDQKDVKGKIVLPSSFTVGFIFQKPMIMEKDRRESGWTIGADFTMQNWSKYRVFGQADSVRNRWELRIGGQLTPVPNKNYFSNITYRAGFFMGPDYIKVGKNLPNIGGSFGMGLPVALNRQAPNQFTIINIALEYNKRGTTSNLLRESLFRFSLGFSLSDAWFGKRKYD
ncbi:MAG: hypothetical protein HOP10_14680 [Chitinophagaceae bacterium]|nr:hypothetical protein [Chitinophagaceae bacterium]